jgi:hypothetical protein
VLPLVVAAGALPVATIPRAPHVVYRAMGLRAPGAVRAPVTFGLVGVAWPAGDAPPRGVAVRTSLDGRHWSEWTDLEIASDEAPDPGTREAQTVSTTPLWVGHARFADVRWTGTMPPHAKLAVVDPGPDPAAPPASSAEASPGMPRIITRAQWGADESIRKGTPEYAEPLQMAFIHHTASGNSYSASQSAGIVRSIYAFHVQGNGWNDIGYNFLVDKYGQIFEGRYGGMTRSLVGAHTLAFNAHSFGVAVIGTFNAAAPPAAAMSGLRQIVAWRLDRAYVDPASTTVMTSNGNPRYEAGVRVRLHVISGHRDVYDTDCPGNAFYAQLPSLRSVLGPYGDPKMFTLSLSTPIVTPNNDGLADAIRLIMHFSSSVSWTVDVLDAAGKKWMSTPGSGTSGNVLWNTTSGSTPAPQDLYRFVVNAHNGHGAMRTATFPFRVWQSPNGTFLRTDSGWLGILRAGRLGHVIDKRALQSRYNDAEAIRGSDVLRSVYLADADVGFRDGSVVRVGSSMWIISDGRRRPVSEATLSALGYSSNSIIDTTSAALTPTPAGSTVTASGGYPNGTALRSSDGREAWVLGGLGRPFLTANVRLSYTIRDTDLAGPADTQVTQAQTRPPVGFRDGSLVRMTGDSNTYVVADGLRRRFTSSHQFDAMGYNRANIKSTSAAELALNAEGPTL